MAPEIYRNEIRDSEKLADCAHSPEVEITPEMVRAGLGAFDAWYAANVSGPIEPMVVSVYLAMRNAKCISVGRTTS